MIMRTALRGFVLGVILTLSGALFVAAASADLCQGEALPESDVTIPPEFFYGSVRHDPPPLCEDVASGEATVPDYSFRPGNPPRPAPAVVAVVSSPERTVRVWGMLHPV